MRGVLRLSRPQTQQEDVYKYHSLCLLHSREEGGRIPWGHLELE